MILLNLFGGPFAGKTAMGHALTAKLKRAGYRVDFPREVARDFILKGQTDQFDNQYYVSAKQYARIRDLERHNCSITISDSPLRQQLVYAADVPYVEQLRQLAEIVENDYDVINVWVERRTDIPFSSFGRNQKDVEEAAKLDAPIRAVIPCCHFVTHSTEVGDEALFCFLTEYIYVNYGKPGNL